jgi:hypothetical protein
MLFGRSTGIFASSGNDPWDRCDPPLWTSIPVRSWSTPMDLQSICNLCGSHWQAWHVSSLPLHPLTTKHQTVHFLVVPRRSTRKQYAIVKYPLDDRHMQVKELRLTAGICRCRTLPTPFTAFNLSHRFNKDSLNVRHCYSTRLSFQRYKTWHDFVQEQICHWSPSLRSRP